MKNAKKIVVLLLCAVLLIGATIAGTVAYLTDSDNVVTNTFTVGKVEITMDEAKVDAYGVADPTAARVTENEYKLIPGHTYTKDPTIHVDDESESCWLFVKIENGIDATLTGQDGWTNITGTDYWKYETVAEDGDDVVVFETFTYSDGITDTTTDATKNITVTAYAIQSDGLTIDEAWTALNLEKISN